MTRLRPGVKRLFDTSLWRRADAHRDVDDEMALHIELRAEQLVREGHDPGSAHQIAREMFMRNNTTLDALRESARDRNRHMRTTERWDSLWQDVKYAARRLSHEPMLTAFTIATLALGLGANVTAFSVFDRILLRGPEHVNDPGRIVRLYNRMDQPPAGMRTGPWLPHTAFVTLDSILTTVGGMAAYRVDDMMVGTGAASRVRRVSRMSPEMFSLLGVRAARGRFYGATDDAPVVVMSDHAWRTEQGSDPAIGGKSISIEDRPYTVVGVAPAGFTGPELGRVDLWIPIDQGARNSMNFNILGRLEPGATVAAASAEVASNRPAVVETAPRFAGWLREAELLAAPIHYDDTARESFETAMARWLAAISAIILIISCANVANLQLARLARRRRELGVRVALGSGRSRVLRLLLLEAFLLAAASAVASLLVVVVTEPVVRQALFPQGAWSFTLADPRLLVAVLATALLVGLLVAVIPVLQAGRSDLASGLRSGHRETGQKSAVRSALTVIQATLSVVLLVGAGLFLRSMQRVNAVDLGMDAERVIIAEARYQRAPRAPGQSFSEWLEQGSVVERERYRRLVDAARRVSGAERAAVSVGVPFLGSVTVSLWVPGRDSIPALPGGGPYVNAVGDDYFATIGTQIRRGRAFTTNDREGTEAVVIVNETMARTLWPQADAIGQCFHIQAQTAPCARIVGIAADVHRSGLKEEPSMQYYVPIGQERGFSGSWILVRTRDEAPAAWPQLLKALTDADPTIRSIDMRKLDAGLNAEMRPYRLGIVAFGLSALLALVVAGLGLYSVLAHSVSWRRHEIGVRLALGARPSGVAGLVVRRSALLAGVGVSIGLVIALAARAWIEPRLFDTRVTDPLVLVGVVVVIEAVALLAGWLPARRAASVSPTESLRAE
jgi:predicted permease